MISINNVEDEIVDQIKELCKNKKYNDAIDIIVSNNINVNDYYFYALFVNIMINNY